MARRIDVLCVGGDIDGLVSPAACNSALNCGCDARCRPTCPRRSLEDVSRTQNPCFRAEAETPHPKLSGALAQDSAGMHT